MLNEKGLEARLREIQSEIEQMRVMEDTNVKEHDVTLVIGGLKNFYDLDGASEFITRKLWKAWAPMPTDQYIKGDYKGIMFLKFETQKERDGALKVLTTIKKDDECSQMWVRADRPLEVRVVQQVTFGAKWLLQTWGYMKRSMWVEEDAGVLWMGDEQVLRAFTSNGRIDIEYSEGWKEFLQSNEWDGIVKQTAEKMAQQSDIKGKGKGKDKSGPKGKPKEHSK